MGIFNSVSDAFVKLIGARSRGNAKAVLDGILEESQKWRPKGHQSLSTKRRHYYEGKQEPYLRSIVVARSPIRGPGMTLSVLNYFKLMAAQEADVMSGRPEYETSATNQEEAFNDMVRTTRVTRILTETERRVHAGRSQYLRGMHNPVLGRLSLDSFWPDAVHIVPHPGAPTSVEHAMAVALLVSGTEGSGQECYEVWSRPDDMSPYEVTRIDKEGNETHVLTSGDQRTWPIELPLPIVAWHAAQPEGMPYVDDDSDVLATQDAINVDWTNLGQMIEYQAASLLVYKGQDDSPFFQGAGVAARIGTDEDINVLDFNAKIAEVQATVGERTRALAVTRRQNPDAYATEPGPPLSGVSRRIQNQPQEEARAERVEMAKEMVEESLLPLLSQLSDAFMGTSIHSDQAEYMFTPDDTPAFEDEDIKQRRILEQHAEGFITKAQAMVALALAETEEAAQAQLDEEAAKKRPAIPAAPGGSRFGAVVLDQLNGAGRTDGEG